MAFLIRHAHARLRNPAALLWLLLAGIVVGLDWYSKQLAMASLDLYQPVEVFPWLNWRLAHNPGAAFSFLAGAGGWQRWFFTILALGVSVALIIWLLRLDRRLVLLPAAIALVIGGALGNAIDRVRFGYVIDFIDVHAVGYHWPAFNVADSAITCGIILLLIDAFRESLAERAEKRGAQLP